MNTTWLALSGLAAFNIFACIVLIYRTSGLLPSASSPPPLPIACVCHCECPQGNHGEPPPCPVQPPRPNVLLPATKVVTVPADIVENKNPVSITYRHFNVTVKVYDTVIGRHDAGDWWQDNIATGKWETHTFVMMNKVLKPTSIYIDFGAWVGPTVLFGAAKSNRVYAMEPNPYVFEDLKRNVELNPDLTPRVTLYHECIADKKGNMSFSAVAKGASIGKLTEGGDMQVTCLTLPQFMQREGIPFQEVDLVKIDTEGAEAIILPTLMELFSTGGKKPAVSLAIHRFAFEAFGDLLVMSQNVVDFMSLFEYVYLPVPGGFQEIPPTAWEMCELCEVFLTDEPLF